MKTRDGLGEVLAWRFCQDGFGVEILTDRRTDVGYSGHTITWEMYSTGPTVDEDATWLKVCGIQQR